MPFKHKADPQDHQDNQDPPDPPDPLDPPDPHQFEKQMEFSKKIDTHPL